jgi:hypothetical protein
MTFSYVDARIVAQRLDDVLTPEGWDFQVVSMGDGVVHGRLVIYSGERAVTREDFGYPNGSDDDEPIKSAASDALKRCAVQVGVGRHLYTDNNAQARPQQAPRQNVAQRPSTASVDGPSTRDTLQALEEAGISTKDAGIVAKRLFGTGYIKDLDGGQRALLLEELNTSGDAKPARSAVPETAPTQVASSPASGPELTWEDLGGRLA